MFGQFHWPFSLVIQSRPDNIDIWLFLALSVKWLEIVAQSEGAQPSWNELICNEDIYHDMQELVSVYARDGKVPFHTVTKTNLV